MAGYMWEQSLSGWILKWVSNRAQRMGSELSTLVLAIRACQVLWPRNESLG